MRSPEDFKLLIVDDEEPIRNVLKEHFELDDFQVFTAESGNKALEVLSKETIDFVISDVRMPDGDGEMLLREIKELNNDIPLILLVSGFSELSREDAIELGALDYLTKPFNLEQVEKIIFDYMNTL